MKKMLFATFAALLLFSGCGTVQSIIKSSFPYTTNLVIPASSRPDTTLSVSSTAASFDKTLGNAEGAQYIKDVKIASAKLIANNPADQSMGIFKTVKMFISSGADEEVMVASRNDVSEFIGSNLVLDIDNSRLLDKYIKAENLKIRMEYTLRTAITKDVTVRTSLSFSSSPGKK